MKKIIHDYDSVSEYFLDSNKVITEIKYLSNNRTKKYVYGVRYIGSIKALTTALMVFSTAFGTALFGLLIDTGFSIEQVAQVSFIYIAIATVLLFFVRNKLNPKYL